MAYLSQSSDEEEDQRKKQASLSSGEAEPASVITGNGSSAGSGPQPYTQSGFASAKNIFSKNANAGDQYDVTKPFQEDVAGAQNTASGNFKTLTDTIGQKVQSQKAGDADLAEAIAKGKDSGGFQKIMSALSPEQISAAYDPGATKYSATDVANLNTAPGIQAAIGQQAAKQGVQNYTQGMGALDAAIYQGSPQYRQKINDTANQYAQYEKQKKDYSDQAAKAIKDSNDQLAENAKNIRAGLEGKEKDLETEYGQTSATAGHVTKGQQVAINNRNAALAQANKQKQDQIDTLAKQLPDEFRQEFLDKVKNVDANQYVNQGQLTGTDAYSAEDADQFNNIMTLLGKGQRVQAGTGPQASVNKDELNKAIQFYYDQQAKRPTAAAIQAQAAQNAKNVAKADAQQAAVAAKMPMTEQEKQAAAKNIRKNTKFG